MSSPYHKYVFDVEKRLFVGEFEKMYQDEELFNFDSWFQNDMNHLTKKLALSILSNYNFSKIIDFGCGKGDFTNLLKKNNNSITGLDISITAIEKAKAKYPKIDFLTSDATYFKQMTNVDLVVAIEVFSYINNWEEVLEDISKKSMYLFLTVYIPVNPIGFIKSIKELENTLIKFFNIETKLIANDESSMFLVKIKNDYL